MASTSNNNLFLSLEILFSSVVEKGCYHFLAKGDTFKRLYVQLCGDVDSDMFVRYHRGARISAGFDLGVVKGHNIKLWVVKGHNNKLEVGIRQNLCRNVDHENGEIIFP